MPFPVAYAARLLKLPGFVKRQFSRRCHPGFRRDAGGAGTAPTRAHSLSAFDLPELQQFLKK